MSTLRKKIGEALEGDSLDLREISKLFGIKEKEVLDHLTHIEKSAHHRGFTVEPASCQQEGFQPKLFYHQINLEQRVPKDHLLRKIREKIDFDFIYGEVRDTYGDNGNVSIPPPVILKVMLLLALYNVRSERELMDTLPMRLDWLWFLGYDLDSEMPNHSVLSKARARWGVEAFRNFFERVVWQCVEAGLVDGRKLFGGRLVGSDQGKCLTLWDNSEKERLFLALEWQF